jgi:hypothetical protein
MHTVFERALGLERSQDARSEDSSVQASGIPYGGVGEPVTFSGGQLAGMTLRAALEEIQYVRHAAL